MGLVYKGQVKTATIQIKDENDKVDIREGR